MERHAKPIYPALGDEGLAAAQQAIRTVARPPELTTSEQAMVRCALLFGRAQGELVRALGPVGAQALVRCALLRAAARHPVLGAVVVTESRILFDGLPPGGTPAELSEAMDDLFCCTMDVVASLIGIELLKALLERVGVGRASGEVERGG